MNTTVAVHLDLFSGDEAEFRLHLKSPGGSVVLNGGGDGDVLSEVGSSGTFTAVVSESLAGFFKVHVTRAGAVVYDSWVNIHADDEGAYTVGKDDAHKVGETVRYRQVARDSDNKSADAIMEVPE